MGGVNYKLHQLQTINPIPPNHLINEWKVDYKIMQEQMIYGDSPSFEKLINGIREIKELINQSSWCINILE